MGLNGSDVGGYGYLSAAGGCAVGNSSCSDPSPYDNCGGQVTTPLCSVERCKAHCSETPHCASFWFGYDTHGAGQCHFYSAPLSGLSATAFPGQSSRHYDRMPACPSPPPPDLAAWAIGAPLQSCTAACAALGLACVESEMHARNGDVDSSAEVKSLIAALGGSTTSGDCSTGLSGKNQPLFHANWCGSPPEDRDPSTVNCTSAPSGSNNPQRLCWCSNAPPPPPPAVGAAAPVSASVP
jgi:hypothetical protein